jgi:dimethyladenosine transferase 1
MSSSLPALPTIKQILNIYGLRAQKQLSQNFLLDPAITDRIVSCLPSPPVHKTVIEVGAGPGGLTRSLLRANAQHVIAVEKDRRFLPALQQLRDAVGADRLTIHCGDMLKLDEADLLRGTAVTPWSSDEPCNVQVIGNLPFGVATELLLKWLRQLGRRDGVFQWGRVPFTLMFQAEVASRIVASPGTNSFGRLSVMTQQSCEARSLLTVRGASFVPPPKVDAAVVTLLPRVTPVPLASLDALEGVLRDVFSLRRKMLRRSITTLEERLGVHQLLDKAGINSVLRAQDLTVAEWCRLADIVHQVEQSQPIAVTKPKKKRNNETKQVEASPPPEPVKMRRKFGKPVDLE